jgi:transposase-like protein
MAKRSDLTAAQRREVVLLLLRREEPAGKLARRFGISEQTLYRWRDEFLAGGEAALANGRGGTDSRDREIKELKKEVERRDQVIGELTIANRILKKTSEGLL